MLRNIKSSKRFISYVLGCFIYGSARKSYLDFLDSLHKQDLRIVLGAFKFLPISSLYAEANEPPLHIRREKLSLQYAAKLAGKANNSSFDVLFDPVDKEYYNAIKPKAVKPIAICLETLL